MTTTSEIFKSMHQYSYQDLERLNLYPGQPQLLVLINENEGISQKELADKKFVKAATITGMLNKLEQNELVFRKADENDKRVMKVYLTERGRHIAEGSKKYLKDLHLRLFKDFSDDEIKNFIELVIKIKENIK